MLQLQQLQKFDKIILGDVKWTNYSIILAKKQGKTASLFGGD